LQPSSVAELVSQPCRSKTARQEKSGGGAVAKVAHEVAGVAGARARQAGGVPGRDGAAWCRSRCRSRCGAARGGVRAEGGEKCEEVVDVDAAVAVDVLAVGAGGAELAEQLQQVVDVDLRVDNDNSARVRSRRSQ